MDALDDALKRGEIDQHHAIASARALLDKHPDNLELHNYLGGQLWTAELKDDAAEIWEKGYRLGTALIPKGFKGEISWYETDNRSFLRVAYGYILGLSHRRQPRPALSVANRLLRWNPSDNQGVRLLMGDLKLMAGDYPGAMKAFLKEAPNAPTMWYSAALIAFINQDFVKACTYLRRGIAGNPYVAEGLTGRTLLADHLYWHGSNLYSCEWAVDFLRSPATDWLDEETDFVDWVFNCSAVLRERADLMEIHEGLTYEHGFKERGPIVQRLHDHQNHIDDELSFKLVRKVVNRWGDEVWPWERQKMNRPVARRDCSPQ